MAVNILGCKAKGHRLLDLKTEISTDYKLYAANLSY